MEQKRYNQIARKVNKRCKFWAQKQNSRMSQKGCFWSFSHTTWLPNVISKSNHDLKEKRNLIYIFEIIENFIIPPSIAPLPLI